jgi:succinyl-CoA synthetase beta subunit
VNIFGGIMKCDIIAQGIINAVKTLKLSVPLVVRLEGTNVELGKRLLKESGLALIAADDLADAAQKAVKAANAKSQAASGSSKSQAAVGSSKSQAPNPK